MEKLHTQFFTFKDENDKYAETREEQLKFHKTISELIKKEDFNGIKLKYSSNTEKSK
jgi:hypothetical protein